MDRYIAATVLKAVGGVLACLLALMTLFTAADELRDQTPGYGAQLALLYVLYSTPRRLCEVAPYGVFVGALVGLGLLAGREELTVLRAAGVSVMRLFASVAAPSLLLLVGSLGVGEFVAPRGEALASTLKLQVLRGRGGDAIAGEHWHREGGLYTYVDGYAADGSLLGIQQYELGDDGQLVFSRRAARAVHLAADEGDGNWLLHDVAETRFPPLRQASTGVPPRTEIRRYETLPWHTEAGPQRLGASALFDPAKLSLAALRLQISHLATEGLDATRYRVAFWRKALEPAAVLGLVLLAVGCVLGPLRETGMGARLAVGVAAGLAFKYLLDLLAPMSSVFGLPPWLGMALPVAVCWGAAWLQVKRL